MFALHFHYIPIRPIKKAPRMKVRQVLGVKQDGALEKETVILLYSPYYNINKKCKVRKNLGGITKTYFAFSVGGKPTFLCTTSKNVVLLFSPYFFIIY